VKRSFEVLSFLKVNPKPEVLKLNLGDMLPNRTLYNCWEPSIIQYDDKVTLTSVKGEHGPGLSNADIEMLYVNGEDIEKPSDWSSNVIPQGIANFFPNLVSLFWFSMNITTVRKSDLKPFPELLILDLKLNQITTIGGSI
jgi:hypothetical protein